MHKNTRAPERKYRRKIHLRKALIFFIFLVINFFALPSLADEIDLSKTNPPTLEVKEIDGFLVPFQNGIPYPVGQSQGSYPRLDLGGIWKVERQSLNHKLTLAKRTPPTLKLIEEEAQGRYLLDFDDSSWTEKQIPSVENEPPDRYQDGVWYRREFFVPEDYKDKFIRLRFEGANYFTDVWVNGRWVGAHEGGYTPFVFDISEYLLYGQNNLIAVRVDNIPWLPHGDKSPQALKVNEHNIVPYKTCDWWNYTGIIRDVYIEVLPLVSIARVEVETKELISDDKAKVGIKVFIYNHSQEDFSGLLNVGIYETRLTVSNFLSLDAESIAKFRSPVQVEGLGEAVNFSLRARELRVLSFEAILKNVSFWRPESPTLYVLRAEINKPEEKELRWFERIFRREKPLDVMHIQFGIRTVLVDKENAKLLLNNKPLFLRGIARHEVFSGDKQAGEGIERIYEDLKLIKETNANFLRTGHYPNHPQTYILADRMGLLVWEEIPVYWFDGPEFDLQRLERGIARQMWLEMIYRDFNRPSIIFWSTSNEAGWQSERALFIKDLKDIKEKIDRTRLVVQSASGADPTDATQKECDAVGFTMYYGVFYGNSYYDDTKAALKKMHKAFPDKPIIATEFGIWAPYGDISQEDLQAEVAKDTFMALSEEPFVAGAVWWTGFDWHTMINEPQTMGAVTMDRKNLKPVYFQLQELYGKFIGNLKLKIKNPKSLEVLSGDVEFRIKAASSKRITSVEINIGGLDYVRVSKKEGDFYKYQWDSTRLTDGQYLVVARAYDENGQVSSDFIRIKIDNVNEPPQIQLNLKEGDAVTEKTLVRARVTDDRGLTKVEYSVDGGLFKEMKRLQNSDYFFLWDVSEIPTDTKKTLTILASDNEGLVAKKVITLVVDNRPAQFVELPFNHDWISYNSNLLDGTGWDFPAEELPVSNSAFIYNSKERIKLKFGNKEDGKLNNVESRGQKIKVDHGFYSKIHILAAMHNGGAKNSFILHYTDGTRDEIYTGFSDWWGANPVYNEELAIAATHHHEGSGDRQPGSGIYLQTLKPNPKKVLSVIELPKEPRLHIFAITLEGKISTDAVPEPKIISPEPEKAVAGKVKIIVVDDEEDITTIEYKIDESQWQKMTREKEGNFIALWDAEELPYGNYTIFIKATDRIEQIGITKAKVRVVNKVSIVFPFEGASIYKEALITVEPRAFAEVEKVELQIDEGEFIKMRPSDVGLYSYRWQVPSNFKAGTSHALTVRETDVGGRVTTDVVNITTDSVKIIIANPIEGHTIKVDKNIRDWIGEAPKEENTATVSKGEFIWKDAKGDDVGAGNYTYPTNKALRKGADLREFRVTWDKNNLYFLIKTDRPGDWWAPYRLIGIDIDGAKGGREGTTVLAQGSIEEPSSDNGCYGEIKVSEDLACEYVVGIFNSYKGRIWDKKGKIVARKESLDSDTPGFEVADYSWYAVEVAIPLDLIGGSPAGKTYRFIVATGLQDQDIFREIEEKATEWRGGGGETSDLDGPDPDAFDLASPDYKTQVSELSSFDINGTPGDPKAFATIEKSYLSVTFAEE